MCVKNSKSKRSFQRPVSRINNGIYGRPNKICTQSCFTLLCLWSNLPILFRVALLALGQSYDCPSASEATLTRSHKSMVAKTNKNMWKLFAYFMGYTHLHILWDIPICIFYGLYCMFSVFNTFTHLYLLTPKWCRIVTKILVNNGSDNGLCCSQTASSYYLNQCWLKITGIHPSAISQKICKMWWKNYHFKLFFQRYWCICQGTMS